MGRVIGLLNEGERSDRGDVANEVGIRLIVEGRRVHDSVVEREGVCEVRGRERFSWGVVLWKEEGGHEEGKVSLRIESRRERSRLRFLRQKTSYTAFDFEVAKFYTEAYLGLVDETHALCSSQRKRKRVCDRRVENRTGKYKSKRREVSSLHLHFQ